jgi:hypothetical protein
VAWSTKQARGGASDAAHHAIQRSGITSNNAIAAALNQRGVKTDRGGRWTHTQVAAVMKRAGAVEQVPARVLAVRCSPGSGLGLFGSTFPIQPHKTDAFDLTLAGILQQELNTAFQRGSHFQRLHYMGLRVRIGQFRTIGWPPTARQKAPAFDLVANTSAWRADTYAFTHREPELCAAGIKRQLEHHLRAAPAGSGVAAGVESPGPALGRM